MKMRRVFTIGESIYDIIFKNEQPTGAKPGGAMLNTSISLGRLNIPVHFLSQFSEDVIGNLFEDFLKKNNVKTDYVVRYNNGKSPISLAFLDNNNNADYTFYKIYPNDINDHKVPDFTENDIVLFGSFYSLWSNKRENLLRLINKAKDKGAFVIYDPNFRKSYFSEFDNYKKIIQENIYYADLVRGSNDDFSLIFDEQEPDKVYEIVQKYGCKNLVFTANARGVFLYTNSIIKNYSVPKIDVISTIGAGDSFNAGLIYSLIKNDISLKNLENCTRTEWDEIIQTAIYFGSHVCTRYDNYIAEPFAKLIINN